jgi:oxygen-independent coproporphyrinogen-3 oxidase
LFEDFAQALACEVRSRAGEITDDVNTLYIGGGTPSVLPLSAFRALLDALRSVGHGGPFDEFTVEVNPEDIIEKGHAYVEGLLELGVNRISMGVQSFDDSVLKFMNRRHSADEAVRAYAILEEAGVRNISIDLIFGLPQLSMDQWRETLDKALSISSRGVLPQHISSYQLSVEPGSMLARLVEKGRWNEASDELCQEQYEALCSALSAAGYHHYEISNFARPGFEAVHNSAYWRHVPYVGFGPGAHSFIRLPFRESSVNISLNGCPSCMSHDILQHSVRQWNLQDLQAYLQAWKSAHDYESGVLADLPSDPFVGVRESEILDEEQLVMERLMLGLRTSAGLPESFLREYCDPEALSQAIATGHLVPADDELVSSDSAMREPHLRIPERHFFISDAIIAVLV